MNTLFFAKLGTWDAWECADGWDEGKTPTELTEWKGEEADWSETALVYAPSEKEAVALVDLWERGRLLLQYAYVAGHLTEVIAAEGVGRRIYIVTLGEWIVSLSMREYCPNSKRAELWNGRDEVGEKLLVLSKNGDEAIELAESYKTGNTKLVSNLTLSWRGRKIDVVARRQGGEND